MYKGSQSPRNLPKLAALPTNIYRSTPLPLSPFKAPPTALPSPSQPRENTEGPLTTVIQTAISYRKQINHLILPELLCTKNRCR